MLAVATGLRTVGGKQRILWLLHHMQDNACSCPSSTKKARTGTIKKVGRGGGGEKGNVPGPASGQKSSIAPSDPLARMVPTACKASRMLNPSSGRYGRLVAWLPKQLQGSHLGGSLVFPPHSWEFILPDVKTFRNCIVSGGAC